MLENKYLSGLPIDLKKFDLGVIHQLTYREIIEKDIDVDNLLKPFLMKKEMMKSNNDEFNKSLNSIGNLGFLYLIDENSEDEKIIENLLNSIKIFYKSDDVYVNPNTKYIHVDKVIIDVEKFDVLSTVVLEMFKVKSPEFEDKTNMDELDKEFAKRREQYKKKTKKDENDFTLIDIVNMIIHTNECGLDYNKIFNMTIYQIKNTYETLTAKYNFETMMQMKLSQFDIKESKIKDWRSKKIIKRSSVI